MQPQGVPSSRALTAAQLAIWSGQKLQPDDPLYNMALAFRIEGALDVAAFQWAFERLVEGCDALRTVIDDSAGTPRQRVLPTHHGLPLIDISGRADPEAALQEWLSGHVGVKFDLSRCPFESALLRLAGDVHVWYLNQHHIVTDASSVAVLFAQQQAFYRLGCKRTQDPVAPLTAFADYVDFEAAQMASPQNRPAQDYWSQQMAQLPAPSRFYQASAGCVQGRTERVEVPWGAARSARMRALAAARPFQAFTPDLSLFQLFATLLFACLFRTTGNTNLALGAPSRNRGSAQFRRAAGLLIEILPLGVAVDENDDFLALHHKVAHATAQMMRHARPGVAGARQHRAFDVVLNFITATFGDFDGLPTQARWLHPGYGDRNHVLRMQVENFDRDAAFKLFLDMNVEMFGAVRQEWLVRHFLVLADAMLADPGQCIEDVELVGDDQRSQLLAGYRAGVRPPLPATDLFDLFEQQVMRDPQAPALACQGKDLTYQELADRAAALARTLADRGIGPGDIVGVMLGRSLEAVVAMLGILRCGAAFLPLDPDYPAARIAYLCKDAQVALVITGPSEVAPESVGPCLVLDCTGAAPPAATDKAAAVRGSDLAYVIYTSGSSGDPKGVMIERHSITNYLLWARGQYLDGQPKAFALFSSLSFDLTLTSVLLPLVSGGSIVVYPAASDGDEPVIMQVVRDNRVEVLKLTPAHLALMQTMDLSQSRVRTMILGGEDLKTDLARASVRRFGGALRIFNEYGPTEATIGCMTHLFDPERDTALSVPVGRAIDGLDVYLLDARRRLVPAGIGGEIHIGGAGLARGYLGQTERTAEKFVDNPFVPGTRMYASGDVGVWNDRNEMVYLGRVDRQVKIRGVRIEPGEIERLLKDHGAITDCAVEALRHGGDRSDPAAPVNCAVCGLTALHPEAHIDAQGVCRICRQYAKFREQAQAYFGDENELADIVRRARDSGSGGHDCMMLLSGGKDSTYALCQLVDLGLRPLVFTLDNGFISDGAMANVRRVVSDLGLELVVGRTDAMNAIFKDSLHRFSNVCNGCFKTIYTLSTQLARQRGIRYVFTGLSRGQIFETRVAGLFQQGVFDRSLVDRAVLQARKAYHRMDDAVARQLDVRIFADDAVFEQVQFIDFYRYREVTLAQILEYLANKVSWVRPVDTGRSTNCRINEVGIHVHRSERGFHNYALPYSWDVRLGHKERDAALAELDDRIDMHNVARVLEQIDYRIDAPPAGRSDRYLVAYYVSAQPLAPQALRDYLGTRLPAALIPSHFVHLAQMPLTTNGKIDRAALPAPGGTRPDLPTAYLAPRDATETLLVAIWQEILGLDRIGVLDNFFDLGGDSIHNIQIVARARARHLHLTPQQLFEAPTIAELALAIRAAEPRPGVRPATAGPVRLLAGQQAVLRSTADAAWQHVVIETSEPPVPRALAQALTQLMECHGALRTRLRRESDRWLGQIVPVGDGAADLLELDPGEGRSLDDMIDAFVASAPMDFAEVPMVRMACGRQGSGGIVVLQVHASVIDTASWAIVLEDLAAAYAAACADQAVSLPAPTASVREWAQELGDYADSAVAHERARHWLEPRARVSTSAPRSSSDTPGVVAWSHTSVALDMAASKRLLRSPTAVDKARAQELILAAVLRATPGLRTGRHRRVEVEVDGRTDRFPALDPARTVGHLAALVPLNVRLAPDGTPAGDLAELARVWRAQPGGGLDFALGCEQDDDAELARQLRQLPAAEFRFRYLGALDAALAADPLMCLARPLHVAPADTRLPLDVLAFVFRGQLNLRWSWDAGRLDDAMVIRCVSDTLLELGSLVDHDAGNSKVDAVDTGLATAGINRDELESLLAEFGATGKGGNAT